MLSLMFAQASLSPLPGRNTAVIAVIQAVTAYMASLSPLEHCTMKEQEQEGFL